MTKDKIFISHSSKDINFIKQFVEKILILGLDIPAERIFCSSMEGQGIRSGQYIPDVLKVEINNSSLALLFVSKNYKTSEVCLNEVGAAWATLSKETIIPLLMPDIDFSDVGFLDVNRLGLKIYQKEGILKLIQDCKENLNPSFNLEKLHKKIEEYLTEIELLSKTSKQENLNKENEEVDEWTDCFINNLYPFNEIIRKNIPAHNDGIHKIVDIKTQTQILTDLSQAKFLKNFWYKKAEGDFYVEQLKRLPSGNWLISIFNWEVNISEMWVSMNSNLQYEFIIFKSEKQEPIKIDSDVGGFSYNVGVLKDGTVISENERLNGYAIIKGETINVDDFGVEPRVRDDKSHWVFLVSHFHKAGFNPDETIKFCEKLDKQEIEVSEETILSFLRPLKNHPVITKYR